MVYRQSLQKRLLSLALLCPLILSSSGCNSKWVNVALADLPIITNIVLQVTAIANPGSDKDIQEYAAEANVDLTLVKSLIDEYNKTKSSTTAARITQLLNEVSGHFNDIIKAAHVKNTVTAQHIEQAIQLALLTVTTIVQLMANQKATAQLPSPVQLQATLDDLRNYNGN